MEVQTYLQTHTLEQLTEEYGIKINKYDDRVVLNYCQINSHRYRFHPIICECRGLILEYPSLKVLSRTFDRFYNYGEDQNSNKFPILNATILSKEDGSLIPVYHDGKEWYAASRGTAFGEGNPMYGDGLTFKDLFEKAINNSVTDTFKKMNPEFTYIFELTSPLNRVVKRYPETNAYLIGVRNKITGKEYHDLSSFIIDLPKSSNFKLPEVYQFNNWDEVLLNIKELPAMDEGYVCSYKNLDDSIWRIKIKNPSYLALAHLRDNGNVNPRRVTTLVFEQDYEEYLLAFPEDIVFFQPYIDAYDKLINDIEFTYNKYKNIETQKDFALAIKDFPTKGILFSMRKNNDMHISWHLTKLSEDLKMSLLNYYI